MRLKDLARIKVGDRDADFWLVRRGSADKVGKPERKFNAQAIGIKATRTDVLDPTYLFYVMMHIWQQGLWRQIATGTTRLVNIKASDVKNIPLGMSEAMSTAERVRRRVNEVHTASGLRTLSPEFTSSRQRLYGKRGDGTAVETKDLEDLVSPLPTGENLGVGDAVDVWATLPKTRSAIERVCRKACTGSDGGEITSMPRFNLKVISSERTRVTRTR